MKKYVCIILLFVIGCAVWKPVGGAYKKEDLNFSVEFPHGWMMSGVKNSIVVTRDGTLLQKILIERLHVDDELKNTKKKFKKGMLPQEAAEVILDNISSGQDTMNFEIIENTPVKVSGNPGFKAVFTYKNKDGLKIKSIYYGFMVGEYFYGIRYIAAQRYYFDKDINTFEKVVESFKLMKT